MFVDNTSIFVFDFLLITPLFFVFNLLILVNKIGGNVKMLHYAYTICASLDEFAAFEFVELENVT